METQKIINLLNGSDNENSKFTTKKWYIIDSESKSNYSKDEELKFLTRSIASSLCDYSGAYILVTWNIAVKKINDANTDNIDITRATQVVFKNCAPLKKCRTEINEAFVDDAEHINITMPMYNLTEYSDNYSDTSGSLWDVKRDETINDANVTNDNNAPSFKHKANFIDNTENNGWKNWVKIAVPTIKIFK